MTGGRIPPNSLAFESLVIPSLVELRNSASRGYKARAPQ